MDNIRAHMTAAHDWVENHRAQTLAVLVLLAAIIFIIGLTMTWFVSSKSLSTVGKIQTPARLKIMGPNQTSIEPIEISYDESRGDVKNTDGTVSVRRAFCVKSNNDESSDGGQAFELQVANTTNIKGLDIKVYKVEDTTMSGTGDVAGLDSAGKKYAWTRAAEVTPFYPINADQADKSLAKDLEQVDPTYQEYKKVQQNARPLYRYHKFAKNELDGYNEETKKANDATNFIIECTWNPGIVTEGGTKVSNIKETDMVYLIVRSASSN